MIEWNKVYYMDCMDEEKGLPSLPDKSIDLCITDPPYGVNYKDNNKTHKKVIDFNDNFISDFSWLDEIIRICKGVIFTPGGMHLYDYIQYKKPDHMLRVAYYYNSHSYFPYDPLLTYGIIPKISSIKTIIPVKRHEFKNEKYIIHPSPKSYDLWQYIIKKLKPKTILDPFLGSGMTIKVCIEYNIPYIGYENNTIYKQDINNRIKNTKNKIPLLQKTLFNYKQMEIDTNEKT